MTTILVVIFSLVLLSVGIFMCKQPQGLFQLIQSTPQNQKFIKRYSYTLIGLGIIGLISSFFLTKVMALWFIGLVLLLSMVFSLQFSKKMSARL
ncbi:MULTISPECIES: hypothetical protein [Enterococcus]|uniref:DUF3784 domain-containing protein n=1 Tax=Enterococcus sulfureus ATCC 49903 TaxID=1140003 RepID=S0L7X0_9ENTE|nr:hypothetical protein [Enterococcus sulfureus]EOT49535.1 hypothetical protein OMY_00463 [Enterococcus sulfureus ATCC 49903]EOT87402.1 hypothetical protein I573_00458 [Enterococcus sulfureus ATCC 49903]